MQALRQRKTKEEQIEKKPQKKIMQGYKKTQYKEIQKNSNNHGERIQ